MTIEFPPTGIEPKSDETKETREIKKGRGGARPGSGRPRGVKSKPRTPLTTAENIQILETKLREPGLSARDMATLTRKVNLLRGTEVPYARNAEDRAKVKAKLTSKSNTLPIGWSGLAPILIERRALGWPVFEDCQPFSIEGRSGEYLERELDRFEIELAAKKGLSSVEELHAYIRWTNAHQGELLPPDCAEAKHAELQKRVMALNPNDPDSWGERLKLTNIALNAGPALTSDQIRDVVLAREKLSAEMTTWRTAEQIRIERFRSCSSQRQDSSPSCYQ
jgi:hypothetical protein